MKNKLIAIIAFIAFSVQNVKAQEWMRIHHRYEGVDWSIPLETKKYSQYDFSSDKSLLRAYAILSDSTERFIPFMTAEIDSIDFAPELTDEEKGHNKYRPFSMHITTDGYENIVERELWLNCHISIDGKGEYSDFSGTGKIRGRGNSSWSWYDKKPYKFKLDEKSKLIGLEKAKNWNLLANYRDVTDMMNVLAFETARYMGMPNTNHSRFVEVFLNEEYIGTYQLTEKIEVAKNRVEIDEEEGIMLSFDKDDGPELSPYSTDNFFSKVFGLPICVKHPEEPDAETIRKVREDFAQLENAIKSHNYELADSLMDIPSYIGILQMHELLFNVEIGAPRSMYLYKDKGGKYTFGPIWDWDAAFDFRWDDMLTGHTYFTDYKELVLGTDPVNATGAYEHINHFFRDLFNSAKFVSQYKEAWNKVKDNILTVPWEETTKYIEAMKAEGTYTRDTNRWPLITGTSSGWWGTGNTVEFKPSEEISKMSAWLNNRKKYLDNVIANYPAGSDEVIDITDPDKMQIVLTINKEQQCKYNRGYTQTGQISISQSEIESALGGTPTELVPLNADGSEGRNTANGIYGAWFDDNGVQEWANGAHVYIESNYLYNWSYGCHPDNCNPRDSHTVTMQYRRGNKAVNVKVVFFIS